MALPYPTWRNTMTKLILILMMVGLWNGCGRDSDSPTGPEGQTLRIQRESWDNGNYMVEYQYFMDGSLVIKHGSYKAWDASGNLLTYGSFDNGLKNGTWFDRADWCEAYEGLGPGLSASDYDYYWTYCSHGVLLEYRNGICLHGCEPQLVTDELPLNESPPFEDANRSNPYDPGDGGITDLSSLLVGTWSRDDAEKNQIYTFKEDGRAELRDFSAPDGGAVDRNGVYPQTLVIRFSGTYVIVGDLLRITFTNVQTNDPGGDTPLLLDKVVNIRIKNDQLTMEERDGEIVYVRF